MRDRFEALKEKLKDPIFQYHLQFYVIGAALGSAATTAYYAVHFGGGRTITIPKDTLQAMVDGKIAFLRVPSSKHGPVYLVTLEK